MKSLLKRLGLGFVLMLTLLCSSITAFAGSGDGGSGGSGGNGGGATGGSWWPYCYGVTINLMQRQDLLVAGGINPANADAYRNYSSGITFLLDGVTKQPVTNLDELVNNAGLTRRGSHISTDLSRLDYLFPGHTGHLGAAITRIHAVQGDLAVTNNYYFDFKTLADTFNNVLAPQKGNTMLYDSDQRREFYRRFKSLVPDVTMSEEDFMTKKGVVVVYPVVGYTNINGGGSNVFMTFPQAWQINQSDKDKWGGLFQRLYSGSITSLGRPGTVAAQLQTAIGTYRNVFDLNMNPIDNNIDYNWLMNNDFYFNKLNDGFRLGFAVYGNEYKGETKASTNLMVKATQNDDGSYDLDAKASMISQEKGDMPVDESLKNGTTTNNNIKGGQSDNGGNVPTLVTNVKSSDTDGYKTYAYGSFLLKGSGNINSSANLNEMRKFTEGTKIQANESTVSSGNFNGGKTYKPAYKNKTPIEAAQYFASSTFGGNAEKIVQSMSGIDGAEVRNIAYNLTAMANNKSKVSSAKIDATNGATAGNGDIKLSGQEQKVGMAVEYVYKSKPIKSYISFAEITYDKDINSSFKVQSNDTVDHTLAEEGNFTINKDRYMVAIVPNSDTSNGLDNNKDYVWNKVKDSIKQGEVFDTTDFKGVIDTVTRNNTVSEGTTNGATVAVGANKGKGYSVYVLVVNAPDSVDIKADVELKDYQLNKVALDMLASRKAVITNSGELVSSGKIGEYECSIGQGRHPIFGETSKYKLYSSSPQGGKTVDVATSTPEKLVYYNSLLGSSYTLAQVNGGINNIDGSEPKRYTYAFNLSRGIFGDTRVISALSSNQLNKQDKDALLNTHKHKYGITAEKVIEANPERDSNAKIVDGVYDTLVFNSAWMNGGKSPSGIKTLTHKGIVDTEDGKTEVTEKYKSEAESGARPLKMNGLAVYQVNVKLNETIHKYSTGVMETGINKHVASENDKKAHKVDFTEPTNSFSGNKKPSDIKKSDKYTYRYSFVANTSGKPLSFVPEVRMRAYFTNGSDTIKGGTVIPRTILTMAEEVRKVKPSTLYVTTVTKKQDNAVTGDKNVTLHSDTMATGTNASKAKGNNLPVIYGGSDVTLSIKDSDFQVNMHGYTLDLINKEKDGGGMLLGNGKTLPYNAIVNDTSFDPYKTWGNTDSADKALEDYKKWTESIAKSLKVDMTLRVTKADSGEEHKSFNNFNVSQGKAQMLTLGEDGKVTGKEDFKADTATKQEGVFPLYVRRGELAKSASDPMAQGYNALIQAIKSDYGVDDATASKIFEESDLYKTICRAVEDTKDDINKSQKVDTSENGAHAVRSEDQDDNWYDEEVKTFVVRRFTTKPVTINDIILSDKLDYNIAPDSTKGKRSSGETGRGQSNAQQTEYKTNHGQWFMTLYLDKEGLKDNSLYEGMTFYNPKDGEVDRSKDYYRNGTVLIDKEYVGSKADFKVPSASTSDMLK